MKRTIARALVPAGVAGVLVACAAPVLESGVQNAPEADLGALAPAAPAREFPGDPEAGREFLLYGNYIGSGVPYELYKTLLGVRSTPNPLLEREGPASFLPVSFNYVETDDGVPLVVGANCLACHGSPFGDTFVVGMGNSFSDWTSEIPFPSLPLRMAGALRYGPDSPEMRELNRFLRGVDALGTDAATPFAGVNPAFRVEELAAAHRDPVTLEWTDEHRFDVPDRSIATDVPAWWLLKKKDRLYYNGMGTGDFAKLIQQITVVGIEDAEAAARIHPRMQDLLAYIRTLEAPVYPFDLDEDLRAQGRAIFENNCASCHGTYGTGRGDPDWTYPNRLVPVEVVGTDPVYARILVESGLPRWYNESWFAITEPRSRVDPEMVYIAPPLDGVWATAPYLHNGSVPTLEALLDSPERPTYWSKVGPRAYDHDAVGWQYVEEGPPEPGNTRTYDTTRDSYGNEGHTFGDDLTDEGRSALIEYLKGL